MFSPCALYFTVLASVALNALCTFAYTVGKTLLFAPIVLIIGFALFANGY